MLTCRSGACNCSHVRGAGGPDTSFFGPNFLSTPAVDGAIGALADCVRAFGAANVFIVSKAAGEVAHKTLAWFEHKGVLERTGVWLCAKTGVGDGASVEPDGAMCAHHRRVVMLCGSRAVA